MKSLFQSAGLLATLFLTRIAGAADFALGLECPTELSGQPGSQAAFDVVTTLTTFNNPSDHGIQGWALGVAAEGARIVGMEVLGMAAEIERCDRTNAFLGSTLTSDGATLAAVPDLRGLVTLPPEGTEALLKLRVQGTFPDAAGPCAEGRMFFVDGLPSSTLQPVRNSLTFEGGSYRPTLNECRFRLCASQGGGRQIPGDCNQDGNVDISDALCVFGNLFLGSPVRLACGEGLPADPGNVALIDWQPDGRIDISDGIAILQFLFLGGRQHALEARRRVDIRFDEVALAHSGGGSASVVAADLNGDGVLDLATSNPLSSSVSVLLGHGGRTYTEKGPFAVGVFPDTVVAVDLNGDKVIDLAVSNSRDQLGEDGSISVLIGSGDGTFQPEQRIPAVVQGEFLGALVAKDLNGDSAPDFLVGSYSFSGAQGHVAVLLGNGHGSFGMPRKLEFAKCSATSPLPFPQGIVAEDFDGDRVLDLAAGIEGGGCFCGDAAVFLGHGDGTYGEPLVTPRREMRARCSALVAGDFNRDSFQDLAVARKAEDLGSLGSGSVSVLLGNGDGTFQAPAKLSTGNYVLSMKTADLDRDGILDLVTLAFSASVSLSIGQGDGTFGSAQELVRRPYTLTGAPTGGDVAVMDMDGDDLLDLAVVHTQLDKIALFFGKPGDRCVLLDCPENHGCQ